MSDKIIKRDGRIFEFDSSKVTAAIVSPEKATGDFRQRTRKNVDLVENYIQKLDWKVEGKRRVPIERFQPYSGPKNLSKNNYFSVLGSSTVGKIEKEPRE